MIDGLKSYPVMKDFGVEWFGDVPEHWACPRTKTILVERVEKNHPDKRYLLQRRSTEW